MIRVFLALPLALLFSGPAFGQSSFSSNNQPRVITGQADLAFWTELVTGGSCTAERLSSAVLTDRARTACEPDDEACHERAGTAVAIACISGAQLTQSCTSSYGSPGTPAFEDCIALTLNNDTHPINGSDTTDEFLSTSIALIIDDLPDPAEITGRTSMTFPERRRILDAIEKAQTVAPVDCDADVADVANCRTLAGFDHLNEVARTSSLAHGLNR